MTVLDVDALSRAIIAQSPNLRYDIDQDGDIDTDHLTAWVKDMRRTWFGDANLDGKFNSNDLVNALATGAYEDDVPRNSGWSEGDWDGDFAPGDGGDRAKSVGCVEPMWHDYEIQRIIRLSARVQAT